MSRSNRTRDTGLPVTHNAPLRGLVRKTQPEKSGYGSSGDQTVDDYDYCDNEKKVYEPAANVDHEEAKYPQDQQNHRDRPEH